MAKRIGLWGWFVIHGTVAAYAAAPDLMVWGPSTRAYVDTMTFAPGSCEVQEGCVAAGTRRVLRFETESRNIGTADLVFGDPAQNPARFVWDPCHNHYHFGQFTIYRLLNQSGGVVVEGRKIGFCLEDTVQFDANAGPRRYHCGFQGIQRGWADRYTYNVPCQFLDITGVPGGTYILDITVDPLNFIPETNENNNNTQVTVQIPNLPCGTPPGNDAFAAATAIQFVPQVLSGNNNCATKEAFEGTVAGNWGGRSVWWKWVSPFTRSVTISTEGSSFDTLLAAYRYAGGNLTLMAENDDVVYTVIRHSEIRFNAVAGTEYRILVDGFDAAAGSIVLNMDTPGNDDFAACFSITGAAGSLTGHNIGASREEGEPSHAATFGTHSVWYCWTAPRTAAVEINTIGSTFDTSLAIYRGNAVNSLTAVASDNDSGANGTSVARFNATSNTVYRIAVDGRGAAMGNISLNWTYLTSRLAIKRNSNGTLNITVTGLNGAHTIQASSDLITWSNVATVNVSNGTGTRVETPSTARRFYRSILANP